MSWNSDQEFWRDFNDLTAGQQGISTGSACNQIGLQTHEANRRAETSFKETDRTRRRSGAAPGAGNVIVNLFWLAVLFMVAAILRDVTGSWWAVGGIAAALIGVSIAAVKFFKTPAGEVTLRILGGLAAAASVAGFAWLVHKEYGVEGLTWMGIIVGTPLLLAGGVAAIRHFFSNTRAGKLMLLWTRRLLTAALVAVVGYGGVVLWLQ